jgi:hypothetical protein
MLQEFNGVKNFLWFDDAGVRLQFCEKHVNNLQSAARAFSKPACFVAFTVSLTHVEIILRLHLSWALTITIYRLVSRMSTAEKVGFLIGGQSEVG